MSNTYGAGFAWLSNLWSIQDCCKGSLAAPQVLFIPFTILHQPNIGPLGEELVAVHLLNGSGDGTGRGGHHTGAHHQPVTGVPLEVHPQVHLWHGGDDVSRNYDVAHDWLFFAGVRFRDAVIAEKGTFWIIHKHTGFVLNVASSLSDSQMAKWFRFYSPWE